LLSSSKVQGASKSNSTDEFEPQIKADDADGWFGYLNHEKKLKKTEKHEERRKQKQGASKSEKRKQKRENGNRKNMAKQLNICPNLI